MVGIKLMNNWDKDQWVKFAFMQKSSECENQFPEHWPCNPRGKGNKRIYILEIRLTSYPYVISILGLYLLRNDQAVIMPPRRKPPPLFSPHPPLFFPPFPSFHEKSGTLFISALAVDSPANNCVIISFTCKMSQGTIIIIITFQCSVIFTSICYLQ